MRRTALGPIHTAQSFFFSAEVSGIYGNVLRPKVMGECLLAESTITLERIGVSGGFESESSYSRTPLLLSNPPDCQLTVNAMNAETSTVCLSIVVIIKIGVEPAVHSEMQMTGE